MTKRPNLDAAVSQGRATGSLLARRGNPTETVRAASLEEAERQLTEAEKKAAGQPRLWAREFAETSLRSIARVTDLEAHPELAERWTRLRDHLAALDAAEFEPLRRRLAQGDYQAAEMSQHLATMPSAEVNAYVQRLFGVHQVPARRTERPAGMVHYVPSPVAVVGELAARLSSNDVFYDIGSGLGLVTMLVTFLTGVRTVGVEYEPAYHEHAVAQAQSLGLKGVRFVLSDARTADYGDGTVFYVYDTFRDGILAGMIERLAQEAQKRPIRVFSRGHSTPVFDEVPWLRLEERTLNELSCYQSF